METRQRNKQLCIWTYEISRQQEINKKNKKQKTKTKRFRKSFHHLHSELAFRIFFAILETQMGSVFAATIVIAILVLVLVLLVPNNQVYPSAIPKLHSKKHPRSASTLLLSPSEDRKLQEIIILMILSEWTREAFCAFSRSTIFYLRTYNSTILHNHPL